MFAKINGVDLLILLFQEKMAITPKVRDEILAPLVYGYTFPLEVIPKIRTVPLGIEALEEFARFQENVALGRGELEAIAFCKAEKCIFATNDIRAREFAKVVGVSVISLQAILKALWKKELKTKKEVREILERIKEADNLVVSRKVEEEIFG